MGIGIGIAELCVREHMRRPLTGVLLLGRQTMLFSPQTAAQMIRDCGATPAVADLQSLALDRQTAAAEGHNIRDDEFFRLLGVHNVHVMDKSDYEGADIIHDLNMPIPSRLESSFDFILDGSTLDNVFDPAMVLRNMARSLRPGGRIVSVNMASNHNDPYTVLSPTWVLDFFVVNKFADCHVAITVLGSDGAYNTFSLDREALNRHNMAHNFQSNFQMGVQFVAEKGPHSTWTMSPSQQQYRSDEDWDTYDANLKAICSVTPPRVLWGSGAPLMLAAVPAGYKFEPGGGGLGAPPRRPLWRRALSRVKRMIPDAA
jgi:SAM-dependent methyltransferase